MQSMTVKIAKASVAATALLLAACSQQAAPVVDGFATPAATFATSQAQIQQNYQKYGSFTQRVSSADSQRVSPAGVAQVASSAKLTQPVDGTETAGLSTPLLPPSSVAMREENLAAIQPAEGQAPTLNKPELLRPTHGRQLATTATLQDVQQPLVDSTPGQPTARALRYTVQPGEGVYPLARRYKVTPQAIFAANHLPSDAVLQTGQVILIPQTATQAAAVTPVITGLDSRESQLQARLDGRLAGAVQPAAATPTPATLSANQQGYVTHTVQPGETIYKLSRQYHVPLRTLLAANDMPTPQPLQTGKVVKVPTGAGKGAVASRGAAVGPDGKPRQVAQFDFLQGPLNLMPIGFDPVTSALAGSDAAPSNDQPTTVNDDKSENSADEPAVKDDDQHDDGSDQDHSRNSPSSDARTIKTSHAVTVADRAKAERLRGHIDQTAAQANGLAWPVQGPVIGKFGEQGNGVMQSGINIAVPENTAVLATNGGTVIYAGNGLRTYGNIVLLRHPDGMVSAYAHNNQLLVAKGDSVKKGQVIALSGATGNVDKPQLHFEIRQASRAVDPLKMLASR